MRTLRAFFRLPGSRSFVAAIGLLLVVAATATAVLAWRYRGGNDLSFVEAIYAVFNMLFFNTVYDLPDDAFSRIVFFALPVLGLIVLGQFVVRLGTALLNREQWHRAVASTHSDHVIVCGLGRVGYRVVRWLHQLREPVVAIELNPANEFLDEVRGWGVPVIVADARRADILQQAGIEDAASIAALSSDDLLNLSVATEARNLRPGIRVVLRTFEDRLAENLKRGFDIYAAYSASSLAAPAFAAAATRAPVDHAFAFGEGADATLITVTRFSIVPESELVGLTLDDLERQFGVSVLAHRHDEFRFHPAADVVVAAGDEVVVSAPIDALNRLAELTPPTRFLPRYEQAEKV